MSNMRKQSHYERMFTCLSMDEAHRVNQAALSEGYLIGPFADRQEELLAHVPANLLQVEDITRDMYPHLDDRTFAATVAMHQALSAKGYRPGLNRSQQEEVAAATLSFMVTAMRQFPAHMTVDYPLTLIK